MLRDFARDLLALLAPAVCAQCQTPTRAALCVTCNEGLPWIDPIGHCALCGTHLGAAAGPRCWRCAATRSDLVGCTAAVQLEEPVLGWVHAFKYPHPGATRIDSVPGAVLRTLVEAAARRAPGPEPDVVMPVPLHVRRVRQRGFNQSAILARAVARCVRRPLDCRSLVRVRDTAPQTGLRRSTRTDNLRAAFVCRFRATPPRLVWLVDDVTTTGATLESAARALRQAGVAAVMGVCAARTRAPTDG